MDLDLTLSIVLVVIATMTIFSRQPFFSVFSLMGLVFTTMIIFLVKGNFVLSSVLLLSMGSVILVIIVQLFMNLDLEKEFQQYYKMNVVPMFGMMVMGIILGVMALVVFGSKDIFIKKMNQVELKATAQNMFASYDNMILLSIMSLIGIVTTAALLLDTNKEMGSEDD
jgi:hypothetical protein